MLRLVCIYTVAGWGASLVLVPLLQFTGYALANALVAITVGFFLPLRELRRIVKVEPASGLWRPFAASVAMGAVVYGLSGLLVRDLLSLALVGLLGGALYMGLLVALDGRRLRGEIREVVAFALGG